MLLDSFRPWTLLIFSIEYYVLTLWTFGLSVPAGVFIPAILTGAAWGRLFGIGVGHVFPSIVSEPAASFLEFMRKINTSCRQESIPESTLWREPQRS